MKDAKYTGRAPAYLPDGRIVEPEQAPVRVDEKEPEVAAMFADGRLIEVDPKQYEVEDKGPSRDDLLAQAGELGITGRSSMNKEELQEAINEANTNESTGDESGDASNDEEVQ